MDQLVGLNRDELLLHVQRKDEAPTLGVRHILPFLRGSPCDVCEAAESPFELVSDDDEGFAFVIALLVELCCFKLVF